MLAIHISREALRYAQLVNFKGTPFIETLGKIAMPDGLQVPDTANGEVIRSLAKQVANIRNSAEFPDNATHVVIDSDWFPNLIHQLDTALNAADREKYLKWRMREMLENATGQYQLVHQELEQSSELAIAFFSLGIPHSLDNWITKVFAPSELEVKQVILEIQAIGDMLAASAQLDSEGGLQVVLENREEMIICYLYRNQEFCGHFQASLNWDYKITLDHVRGARELVEHVAEAIAKAIKGKKDPENVLTNLLYFNSTGDPTVLNNLKHYTSTCRPLDLVNHFNFRDPEIKNIDEYAVVLGALSKEIQERFSED